MRVAPDREISINGRRYLAGDTLPELSREVASTLLASGDIIDDRPPRDDKPRHEGHRR